MEVSQLQEKFDTVNSKFEVMKIEKESLAIRMTKEQQHLDEANAKLVELKKEFSAFKQKAEEEKDQTKNKTVALENQLMNERNEKLELEKKQKEAVDKVRKKK